MSESVELEKKPNMKEDGSENKPTNNAKQMESKTQKTAAKNSTSLKSEGTSDNSMPIKEADTTSAVLENRSDKSESKDMEKHTETENTQNTSSVQSENVTRIVSTDDIVSKIPLETVSKDNQVPKLSTQTAESDKVSKEHHVPKISTQTAEPDKVSKDNLKISTQTSESDKVSKDSHMPKLPSEAVEESDDEDDEGICLGDGADLDGDGRNKMFEKGLNYERNGKRNKALKCYMACLSGLKQETRFPLLPQCLRNIADIFYQKEEYDKAVHFIQAEKVYYESALIDTTDVQQKLEEAKMKEGSLSHSVSTDTVRASEYEHLARLCLDKGQPQLALEYAGKATKLRQSVLGDKDPVTVESLDFFATVYAKVGAEQYEESLKKFTEKPDDSEMSTEASPMDESGDQKEPVSILRKRKNSEIEKKVRFDESQLQSNERIQHEERFAKSVLWALMVICFILLVILGIYLYCNLVGSNTCTKFRGDLHYAYMRLKYWYYQYQAGPNAKFM